MSPTPDPSMLAPAQILFLICLILFSAVFKASETAILSSNKTKVKNIAQEGNKKAARLLELLENPERYISAIQMVFTFLTLLMSVLVAVSVSRPLSLLLANAEMPHPTYISIILITVVLSAIVLILGQFYPKRVALNNPEKIAIFLVKMFAFLAVILRPFVFIAEKITELFLIITRQNVDDSADEFFEDEVMSMLEVGQETGVLKEEGKKMIDSIFAFDDKMAYEIMTPRTDVFTIDINDTPEEYIDELMEMRYSRIPVYENDSDDIIGILNIKDFLIKARADGFDNVELRDILRKPYFVPERKKLDSLFFDLQSSKEHIAILIDEYGGFSGIVTMEDIIEEVMGDITDEYDEEESEFEIIDENTYLISGFMHLDDLNENLGLNLESENETIGGFLIDILGEIPDDGDTENLVIEYENLLFTITSVKERRIETLKLYIKPESESGETDEKNN